MSLTFKTFIYLLRLRISKVTMDWDYIECIESPHKLKKKRESMLREHQKCYKNKASKTQSFLQKLEINIRHRIRST